MIKLNSMNKAQKYTKLELVAAILGCTAAVHNLSGHVVEFFLSDFYGASGVTGGFSSVWMGGLAIFFAVLMVLALIFVHHSKPKIAGFLIIFGAFGCSAISFSVGYIAAFIMSIAAGIIWFSVKK